MSATSSAAVLLLLSLSVPVLAAAQTGPSANDSRATLAQEENHAKEPYVFELIQTTVRFEADGRGQRDLTIRVRIQSESAVREFGLLAYQFSSSFESLDVTYVRVKKPDGSVVETPATDVQELDSAVSREAPMYSDEREKHVAVKSLTVGDILEASFRWTIHDPLAPGHFWFDDSYFRAGICLKETLELDLPRGTPVKFHYSDPQPTIEERGDRRLYTFQRTNLKKPKESKIPSWEKDFHGIDPPDVRLSSFGSWQEVGNWFSSLEEPKTEVTPQVRAKAEELTKGKINDEEKMRSLYEFVSTHFRYIGVDLGIGRYAPHSAADVLANRYGDCKDKHTLLAALLKAVGIPAYPVLISSRFRLDASVPSVDLFDHVITAIPKGESFLLLDTTPEVAPFGLLLPNLRDRQALVMPRGSAAKLVLTPPDPLKPNYEIVKIDSAIDAQGTLDAKMRIEEAGDGEVFVRAAYRATPQNRWDELTQQLVHRMGFAGTVSDVSVAQPDDTTRPFVISFAYHRTDYPDWKNHQISLPTPFFALQDLTEEQKASKTALPLGSPQDVTYETTVKLPKDYSAIVPENITHKTEFAEFSASYVLDKDAAVVHGTLHLKTLVREVPGGKREEYAGLTKSIDDATRRYIPITGNFLLAGSVSTDLITLLSRKPEAAVPELEKNLANHPDDEETALFLARAYIKTGRAKEATVLLEKKLAGNPENARGFNFLLGEAYLAVPDPEKAMDRFKKSLGDSPNPMALNNVAYDLAEANVRLSDAESYSNQAIVKISADAESVAAEKADTADFQLMTQLAANWDTLGWIKFRAGDFEKAEKYLVASWELMQNPVVGEHVVEVYEKLGKKRQAAAICVMARSAYGHEQVDDKLAKEMDRLRPFLQKNSPSQPWRVPSDGSMALSDQRTVHVPFHTKLEGNSRVAQVVISLRPGSEEASVTFISGAEELRKGISALAVTKYPQTFPDNTPVQILRKAAFSCSVYTKDCVLLLVPATDAAVPGS